MSSLPPEQHIPSPLPSVLHCPPRYPPSSIGRPDAAQPRQSQDEQQEQQRQQQQQQQQPQQQPQQKSRRPRAWAKACVVCRARKIRCDALHPRCTPCRNQDRQCSYQVEAPRKRPTHQQITDLKQRNAALCAFVVTLRQSSPDHRDNLLAALQVDEDGNISTDALPGSALAAPSSSPQRRQDQTPHPDQTPRAARTDTPPVSSDDDELEIDHFISVDDAGEPASFGPSSALHNPARSETGGATTTTTRETASNFEVNARNRLIAGAALQRQLEPTLGRLSQIAGVPTQLALHLLSLHWARQHHSFLLTYRPAIMRDLACSGPYCSEFLLVAIFACSSKYSPRLDIRDDPGEQNTAGARFFRRCDDLLAHQGLLSTPSICTVIGLVLLGSTYNARGETSKAWLWTGYALRMVYDLGLHLDPSHTTDDAEEIEIKRRVFWGAFVCDKLQSLYLGRPVAINLRDSQVSRKLYDMYEEQEPFQGLVAAPTTPSLPEGVMGDNIPILSVSTFQQLCLLSKIMTTIINRLYVVGATLSNAQTSLELVEKALHQWKNNLTPELDFKPWLSSLPSPTGQGSQHKNQQPPNVMILHNLYHSLIILVHRPFISDGHLRSSAAPERSWEQCTMAAKRITVSASCYRSAFTLSAAPYVLGYTIYVACTIHVRNAASQERPGEHWSLLEASLECLDELCLVNHGVRKPTRIIRCLMEANKVDLHKGGAARDFPTSDTTILVGETIPQPDLVSGGGGTVPTDSSAALNFNMDAILNMFPTYHSADPGDGATEAGGLGSNADFMMPGYRTGFDYELPADPLFGMMGMPAMTYDMQSSDLPPR